MNGIGGKQGWSWIFILVRSSPSTNYLLIKRSIRKASLLRSLEFFLSFLSRHPRKKSNILHHLKDSKRLFIRSSSRKLSYLSFRVICQRLLRDRSTAGPIDHFSMRDISSSLRSPHVLLNMISFFMAGNMLYGLAIFLPSIVSRLGFSSTHTQLLSVGPFAAGFFCEYISNIQSLINDNLLLSCPRCCLRFRPYTTTCSVCCCDVRNSSDRIYNLLVYV